jgi:hypothetical protein
VVAWQLSFIEKHLTTAVLYESIGELAFHGETQAKKFCADAEKNGRENPGRFYSTCSLASKQAERRSVEAAAGNDYIAVL